MKAQTPLAEEDRKIGELVKLVLSALVLLLIIIWTWNEFRPGGRSTDFFDFALFFGRELLVIVPFILVAVVIALVAAWRFCARWVKRRRRAREA
ncbi:hypothetical protein [Roseateles chitinivorans]|uniref:hypothetical protein n=1 Tax=Roseateles chitinivorans TaxID=2917965 RepID=UPI003D67043A